MWTQAERRALRYIATGDYDRAIEEYRNLLSEVGDDPDIFNAIGDLYVKKKDFENAVKYYEKAVELYRNDGMVENAIAVARKALRYNPDLKHLYLVLAELYSSIGRHDEAIGYLAAFLQRGVEKEEFDMVLKSFKTVATEVSQDMERLPRFERLFNKLQQIIEEVGERSLDEAEKEYQKAGYTIPKEPWPEPKEIIEEKAELKEAEAPPVEERPPHKAPSEERELTEEEIEKLAEFPTGELEEQLWRPTERPAEPWEHRVEEKPVEKEPPIWKPEEKAEALEAEMPPEEVKEEVPSEEEVFAVQQPTPEEFHPEIPQPPEEAEIVEEVPLEEVEKTLEEIIESSEIKIERPVEPEKALEKPSEEVEKVEEKEELVTQPAVEMPVVEVAPQKPEEIETNLKRDLLRVFAYVKDFITTPFPLYFPDVDMFELGFVFLDMGLYEAAVAHFQLGLKDKSKRHIALKMSALALLKWGKFELAIRQLKKAMQLKDDIEVHYLLAQCYESLGRYEDALNEYEEVFLRKIDYKDVAERISRLYDRVKRS